MALGIRRRRTITKDCHLVCSVRYDRGRSFYLPFRFFDFLSGIYSIEASILSFLLKLLSKQITVSGRHSANTWHLENNAFSRSRKIKFFFKMNRIVENKLTFDYIGSIIKISTQRMDQESNVSFFFFPGWITRNQVKNILLPGNLVLFGNEFRKRINKETSKIFFSFKKKTKPKEPRE